MRERYHQGIASYTLGQKRKLAEELSGKFVVIGISAETNTVILGGESDLFKYKLTAESFNLINSYHTFPMKVQVIVSQWSAVYEGILMPQPDGSAEITFQSPVRAPSCGQAMVCYQDTLMIGGGIITQVE
ncbi:aminomethyltransferase beta-barrel domain-containing protein [Fusibacter sp. 3D3]|uniref:aminomethyltransferase beta-barrel domain-containing protein n=1 Tax=Fusibacter sp. 3D3 TaxID=1048380 RepID=UPI0008538851|nr:aminomethyltransferase beta-barrel domain-containing protein [Fusibacter sp. 3D3]GAU76764.1 tRNA-specific 2-thiouridylase MnmA [Fusibacter sp. 3D3]